MGALTTNRKRADNSFILYGPLSSSSINCSYYSNRIDTNLSKKPRVVYVNRTPQLHSSVGRLDKYPKPVAQLRREVHVPCKVKRTGFFSCLSSQGFKSTRVLMGIFFARPRDVKKQTRLGSSRHLKARKEEEENEAVSEDSSDVVILEDEKSGRFVSNKGLGLVLESRGFDEKWLENFDASNGNILHSSSLDREAYKKLVTSRDKRNELEFEIRLEEARLSSIRSPDTWKKKQEKKEPEEDLLNEPFVSLSEEEESEVKHALSNINRNKVLVTHENSNIQITGAVLQCLRPRAWLNDEVINVYLELLKERERRDPKKYLNCHFFNTFFYKKLIGGRNGYEYKDVKRWTSVRKLGYTLNECDKIFVPIHKEVHWCLAVINKKDEKFQYLDSLGERDPHVLGRLAMYYVEEIKDKCGEDIDVSAWEREYVEDLPEQQNGSDCGMFMIKYADFYSRGLGLHFTQENMPYFRLRTAHEILKLQAQ